MNYIKLNNTDSRTIPGLLIQALPPISKPLVRSLIEEIDGRDGDIVTRLGFSAYDKEVQIGLFGNYDIDQVVAFFNSEGQVVFSNEADKYYRYQVLEQIDFEKLIRYRTALVRFHVQPFKFSVSETARSLANSGGTVTNSGNVNSKPKLTLRGSGNVSVSLNGVQILQIAFGSTAHYMTIDAEEMNAYYGGTLLNREVTGDYSKLQLIPGSNTLSISGSATNVSIEKYSRWL